MEWLIPVAIVAERRGTRSNLRSRWDYSPDGRA